MLPAGVAGTGPSPLWRGSSRRLGFVRSVRLTPPHAELSGGALPDWVVWYLAAPLGTSVQSGSAGSSSALLSKALAVPVNRITAILHGQRSVTAGHGVTAGAVLRDDAAVVAPAADLRAAAGREGKL